MHDLVHHHERIRRRGVNALVYWLVRAVLQPLIQVWFRLGRHGRAHVPASGPVIAFPRVEAPSPRLVEEVTARIWPCVELQWEWLELASSAIAAGAGAEQGADLYSVGSRAAGRRAA